MKELYRHLRDAKVRRAYLGVLFKRHRAILAYILVVLAVMIGFDRSNDATIERLERTITARCERINEFRQNTNYQFDLFVNHNNAAVKLFYQVGDDLREGGSTERFRRLGDRFTDAADHYRKLSLKFKHVPYEDCDRAISRINDG